MINLYKSIIQYYFNMSSKPTIIREFNQILETFLSQLSPLIGTTYHHYFKQLIKVNAILPIQQFSNNAYPHKKKIFEEDETYFADTDTHKSDINNMQEYFKTDEETTLNEILRLKDIYYQLDQDSKKEVWSYFKALTLLSEDYIKLSK